jgi:hypothetical protein
MNARKFVRFMGFFMNVKVNTMARRPGWLCHKSSIICRWPLSSTERYFVCMVDCPNKSPLSTKFPS